MRIRLLILLGCLTWAMPAWAVTRDTVTSNSKNSTGTTLTQSHTVTASGGNRIMYVLCGLRSRTVTLTATYAGAAMDEVRKDQHGSTQISSWMFRKINPATGANDWEVTQSGGTGMACAGFSVTNAHQTVSETDTDGICGTTNPESLTLTDTNDDLLIDVFAMAIDGSVTEGADQTEEIDIAVASATLTTAVSRQLGTADGVMSQTANGANNHCYTAISIAHSAATTSRPPLGPIILGWLRSLVGIQEAYAY